MLVLIFFLGYFTFSNQTGNKGSAVAGLSPANLSSNLAVTHISRCRRRRPIFLQCN